MAVRTNTELTSQLPVYTAKRSEDHAGWLLVTCPREDCGDTFLVHGTTWMRRHTYEKGDGTTVVISGRACPYCFKAGRLPSRRSIR